MFAAGYVSIQTISFGLVKMYMENKYSISTQLPMRLWVMLIGEQYTYILCSNKVALQTVFFFFSYRFLSDLPLQAICKSSLLWWWCLPSFLPYLLAWLIKVNLIAWVDQVEGGRLKIIIEIFWRRRSRSRRSTYTRIGIIDCDQCTYRDR